MSQITITGNLGRDREIRVTRQRTYRAERYNEISEDAREIEICPPTRDYALLRVATHATTGGRITTRWHRVIVWNADTPATRAARLARKGDRVRIEGHRETFRWIDDAGQPHAIDQIIAHHVQLLAIKPRRPFD